MTEFRHDPDSLAAGLDAALPPGCDDVLPAEGDPLVEVAARLAGAPRPQLSPAAMARIQAQVMEAHRQRVSARPARWRLPPALRWAVAAGLVVLLTVFGLTPATLASVPGEALYPIKQAVEAVELALAVSTETRASVHLAHAERRLQEALMLLERSQWTPDLFIAALDEMAASADVVRADPALPEPARQRVEARTIEIVARLNATLHQEARSTRVPQATLMPFMADMRATQEGGRLLLPVPAPSTTPMPAPMQRPTGTPATVRAPTSTPDEAQVTAAPDTAGEHVRVVEGVIESIEHNLVRVQGVIVEFDPDDPLLTVMRAGDLLRAEGQVVEVDGSARIRATAATIANVTIDISEDGQQAYRDDEVIDCSNPPPAWAPASGWRARCEDAPKPGGGRPDGQPGGGRPPDVGPPPNPGRPPGGR